MRGFGRGGGVFRVAPIRPTSKWDLLPNGRKVLGVNISPRNNDGVHTSHLADFWKNWEWSAPGAPGDAGNWIKPQIDAAKALGANTVRVFWTAFGRPGVGSGYATPIDTATFLAHSDQLLSYIRSQGMYCYPTLSSDGGIGDHSWYGYTATLNWLLAENALLARFFAKYADIIPAVDLCNECSTWASTSGQGAAVYQACKAEAPMLKYTWSEDIHSAPGSTAKYADFSRIRDFIDFHIYYDPAPGDLDAFMSAYNMPLLAGEFGQAISAGAPARQSRYTTVKALVNNVTSGRQAAGALAWSMYDQDTVAADQWGIANAIGVDRGDVSAIFSTFPS